MQSNPRKQTTGSSSKPKEKTSDEAAKVTTEKPQHVLATPRNVNVTKSSTVDIYSQPKKSRDKIGPGPVTDRNGPRITAREISHKDTSSNKNVKDNKGKIPSKSSDQQKLKTSLKLGEEPRKTYVGPKKEITKNYLQRVNSHTLTNKSSKPSTKPPLVDTAKRKTVSSEAAKASKKEAVPSSSNHRGTPRLAKDLPFVGLLVNSPPSQRKHSVQSIPIKSAKDRSSNVVAEGRIEKEESKTQRRHESESHLRQRGKTITLDEKEVKVLNQEGPDNNIEMKNLTHKLTAKPKAFYIDLEDDKKKVNKESNEEDNYSYEDDFDSYESDFESYKSDTDRSSSKDVASPTGNSDTDSETAYRINQVQMVRNTEKSVIRNVKPNSNDEEKMLDSGSFELREAQRSATKVKTEMEDIQEKAEVGLDRDTRKQASLTDEGFLEMSSSSAVSSMRTLENNYNIERPSFIDLTRAKANKKRRLIHERQKQRASDLLNMITLHQVSYVLFDLKPIPYESFMEIFGTANSSQTSCQTYDDGVTEEIQTEEIYNANKWTQHPVEFSRHDIHHDINEDAERKDDFESKFLYLWNKKVERQEVNEEYKNNPLRIFLEQKHGVGTDRIMPYEGYERITNKTQFNVDRLSRFLAKSEKNMIRILSKSDTRSAAVKPSKWPFSKGYINLFENVETQKLLFLDKKPVEFVVFSETSENLILTVHKKIHLKEEELEECSDDEILIKRCVVCLWDLSVASVDVSRLPIKVMVAVDNVAICRFRGSCDGLVAGALEDGSIHLWDLSEAASWHGEVFTHAPARDNVKQSVESEKMSVRMRSCAYTDSARSLEGAQSGGSFVGLQFLSRAATVGADWKVLGQLCSLRIHGVLCLWTIVKEKVTAESVSNDIGKAYWSNIKLQKSFSVNITESMDHPLLEMSNNESVFNLAAVKRRLGAKRQVVDGKKQKPKRPQTSKSMDIDEFEDDSVASDGKKKDSPEYQLPAMNCFDGWETGIVCTDLKVMMLHEKLQRFLVARNCGEVVCCERSNGNTQLRRFKIACNATTVTALEPSTSLPYFLAGTDSGLIVLFSLAEERCFVTLDCWSRVGGGKTAGDRLEMAVENVHWLRRDPCSLLVLCRGGTLCQWQLARSDVTPTWRTHGVLRSELTCARQRSRLAVLSSSRAVEIHEVVLNSATGVNLEQLFTSYVSLL